MNPLVDQEFLLERFPGKGGWTYARIPQITPDKNAPFGWVKVKGTIDGYEIKQYHLMPMGNGILFLPVKADIRKKIRKQEGDMVRVILYPDSDPLVIPDEMLLCIEDEPAAHQFFNSLSESEKRYYVNWVYSAKQFETKVRRLTKTVERLANCEKFYGNE